MHNYLLTWTVPLSNPGNVQYLTPLLFHDLKKRQSIKRVRKISLFVFLGSDKTKWDSFQFPLITSGHLVNTISDTSFVA